MVDDKKKRSIEQLKKMIKNYPDDEIDYDVEGVIIDYLTKEGCSVFEVFEMNAHIYEYFISLSIDDKRLLVKSISDMMNDDEISEIDSLHSIAYSDFYSMLTSGENDYKEEGDFELYNKNDLFIWHISDIHFGKFYKKEYSPNDLAQLLVDFTKGDIQLYPSIILISGDVTSVCKDSEFDQFIDFCKSLSLKLWGKVIPQKFLLVPGNHDINWEDIGENDKLAKFRKHFGQDEFCISPFGKENCKYDDVEVHRYINTQDDEPPITEVLYPKHRLRFLLLTSCYYSGEISDRVLEYMRSNNISDKEFGDLIRIDKGHLSVNYLGNLYRLPRRDDYYSFGLIHHNPVRYGVQTCESTNAEKLLLRLREINVNIVFHGHTHLAENISKERPHFEKQAYAIACPTLSSVPSNGPAGMNFYMINSDENRCMVKTATLSFDDNDQLSVDKNCMIHTIEIIGNDVQIEC